MKVNIVLKGRKLKDKGRKLKDKEVKSMFNGGKFWRMKIKDKNVL